MDNNKYFFYRQRDFEKLGKAASSTLQILPILVQLFVKAETINLATKIFITKLEVLVYFN